MTIEELNERVTRAILHAESCAATEASEAWGAVAVLEEAVASQTSADTVAGEAARVGAVRAHRCAGRRVRARELALRYCLEPALSRGVRRALQELGALDHHAAMELLAHAELLEDDASAAHELLRAAAEVEQRVADRVPEDRARTRGVLRVSAVSIWLRAGEAARAGALAARYLAEPIGPGFARELRELHAHACAQITGLARAR